MILISSTQDAAIKAWDFPNIRALGEYVLQVSSDRNIFQKHIAWKNMRIHDLSPQFLKYWNASSASGDRRKDYFVTSHSIFAFIAIL
jgi:hypothetical protein